MSAHTTTTAIGTPDVIRDAGATWRQVDYWCSRGFVPGQPATIGSGRYREYTDEQMRHVREMSALVKGGMRPDVAARAVPILLAGQPVRIGGYVLRQGDPQ